MVAHGALPSGWIESEYRRGIDFGEAREAWAEPDDLRVMSTQALPYMLVNAIQELEAKVVDLERRLAAAESQAAAAGTAHP